MLELHSVRAFKYDFPVVENVADRRCVSNSPSLCNIFVAWIILQFSCSFLDSVYHGNG